MGDNDRMQQRINDNIADLPFFYGETDKDTVSLKHYISRVDQGVATLTWTQAQAFVYFKNSLKGAASDWLDGQISDNRNRALQWDLFKPAFRTAFGDTADEIVFASEIGNIKLTQFDGNLFKYYAAITRMINLHQEPLLAANLRQLPDNHGLNAANLLLLREIHKDAVFMCHDLMKKEFFISGLSKAQQDRIANKPHLVTASDIMMHLKRNADLDRKRQPTQMAQPPPPTPAPAAPLGPVYAAQYHDEQQQAAAFQQTRQQSNRGQQRGRGQRGRGAAVQPRQTTGPMGPSGSTNGGAGQQQQSAKPFFCIFCRKPNHNQDDCRQRIAENAPCLSKNGVPYFPRNQNPIDEEDMTQNGSIFSNSVFS